MIDKYVAVGGKGKVFLALSVALVPIVVFAQMHLLSAQHKQFREFDPLWEAIEFGLKNKLIEIPIVWPIFGSAVVFFVAAMWFAGKIVDGHGFMSRQTFCFLAGAATFLTAIVIISLYFAVRSDLLDGLNINEYLIGAPILLFALLIGSTMFSLPSALIVWEGAGRLRFLEEKTDD